MKMTGKSGKVLTLLLAGAMAGSMLAGCSGGGNSSSAPASSAAPASSEAASSAAGSEAAPAASGEDITLRIAWWGNQLRNDTTNAMLAAYTEENPNVKFEAEFIDWSGYWDRLATQAASGNMPDIIQQDYSYIAQYHARNQLANLSEQVEKGNLNLDDVSESILATGMFDGQLYALCIGMNAVCTIYDVDVLTEAGVTMPEHPTYSEIMDIAATVYEKTGVRGETPGGYGSMCMMARDQGQMIFDVENNCLGIGEDIVLKYFNQIKATIDSPWSTTVDMIQEASTAGLEAQPLCLQTSCYNFPGGSNQLDAMQNATDHKLALAMYPKTDDATTESMYLRPSQFFSIVETSQYKDEAARVIDYYTNSEKAQDCLQAERGVPVSSKMADYIAPKLGENQQVIFDYIAKVTEVAVPFDPPLPNGASEANKLLDDLTDLVRYGELTPEEATARYIPEANDILSKANAA